MNLSSVGRSLKSKSKETLKRGATKVGSAGKELARRSALNLGKKLIGKIKDPSEQLDCLKKCLACITHKEGEACPNCDKNDVAQTPDEIDSLLERVNSDDILCCTDGENSLIYCPSERVSRHRSKSKDHSSSPRDTQSWRSASSQHSHRRYSDERQGRNDSRSPSESSRSSSVDIHKRGGATRRKRSATQNSTSSRVSRKASSDRLSQDQQRDKRGNTERDSEQLQRNDLRRTREKSLNANQKDLDTQQHYVVKERGGASPSGRSRARKSTGRRKYRQDSSRGHLNVDRRSSSRRRRSISRKHHKEEAEDGLSSTESESSGSGGNERHVAAQSDSHRKPETSVKTKSSVKQVEAEQGMPQPRKSSLKRRSDQQNETSQNKSDGEKNERSSHETQNNQSYETSLAKDISSSSALRGEQETNLGACEQERNFFRDSSRNCNERVSILRQQRNLPCEPCTPEYVGIDRGCGPQIPTVNVSFSPKVSAYDCYNESQPPTFNNNKRSWAEQRKNSRCKNGVYSPGSFGGYLETLQEDVEAPSLGSSSSTTNRPCVDHVRCFLPSAAGFQTLKKRGSITNGPTVDRAECDLPLTAGFRPSQKQCSITNQPAVDHATCRLPSLTGFPSAKKQFPRICTLVTKESVHRRGSSGNVCCRRVQQSVCRRNSSGVTCCSSRCSCKPNKDCCQNNHFDDTYRSKANKENFLPENSDCCPRHLLHSPPKDFNVFTCVACNDPNYFENGQYEEPASMCNYHRLLCQQQKIMFSDPDDTDDSSREPPKVNKFRAAMSLPRFCFKKSKNKTSTSKDNLAGSPVRQNPSNQSISSMQIPMYPVDPNILRLLYKNKQKCENLCCTPQPEAPRSWGSLQNTANRPSMYRFSQPSLAPWLNGATYSSDPRTSSTPSPYTYASNPRTSSTTSPYTYASSPRTSSTTSPYTYASNPRTSSTPSPYTYTSNPRTSSTPSPYAYASNPRISSTPSPYDLTSISEKPKSCVTLDYRNQRVLAENCEMPRCQSYLDSNNREETDETANMFAGSLGLSGSDPLAGENPQLFELLRKSSGSTDANLLERVAEKFVEPSVCPSSQPWGAELTGYDAFLLANPEIQPPMAYDLDAKKCIEERMAEARGSFYKYLSPESCMSCRMRATERRCPPCYQPRTNSMRWPPENQLMCECTRTGPGAYEIRGSMGNFSSIPGGNAQFSGAGYGSALPAYGSPGINPILGMDNAPLSEIELECERWDPDKDDWKAI